MRVVRSGKVVAKVLVLRRKAALTVYGVASVLLLLIALRNSHAEVGDVPKSVKNDLTNGDKSQLSKTTYAERLQKLPIIISGPLPGGVGNQIEVALQHIGLAHRQGFEYFFPPMMTRTNHLPVNAGDVWELTSLRGAVGKIHTTIPPACDVNAGGKWDIFVQVNTKTLQKDATDLHLSASTEKDESVTVNIHRYGLQEIQDLRRQFVNVLLSRNPRLQEANSERSAICVHLEIHSAPSSYSFAPLLRPNKTIQKLAQQWHLDTLGVLHLRFDESKQGCGAGAPQSIDPLRHVCLLQNGPLSALWIPHAVYVKKITTTLMHHGVREVYLTRSKYMPEVAWQNLRETFRKRRKLRVAKSAAGRYDEEVLNYLERELATKCKFFVSEARSTWSRTVVQARNDESSYIQAIDIFKEA
jgi:hypothetical protein